MKDHMSAQYGEIFETARDLGLLILEDPDVRHYREVAGLLNEDERSVDLLNRLITMGRELRDNPDGDGAEMAEMREEYEWVKSELADNDLVKTYITLQKEYVALLTQVFDKVRNPEEG